MLLLETGDITCNSRDGTFTKCWSNCKMHFSLYRGAVLATHPSPAWLVTMLHRQLSGQNLNIYIYVSSS